MAMPLDEEIAYQKMDKVSDGNMMDDVDAVNMLSNIFHRILKVNLTNDSQRMISVYRDEISKEKGYSSKLSEWLINFGKLGFVHEEDIDGYNEFVDIDNLRKAFKDGERYISGRYRRKIGDAFRWVQLEITKSSEYSDDNQVVLMYTRDINEEFMKQLSSIEKAKSDSVGSVVINVTKNEVLSCGGIIGLRPEIKKCKTLDEYVEIVVSKIPSGKQDEKEEFKQKFSRDSLKKQFNACDYYNKLEHIYIADEDKGEYLLVNTVVNLRSDAETGDIMASFFAYDISEEYVDRKLPEMLYENEYEAVAIIDEKTEISSLRKIFKKFGGEILPKGTRLPYDIIGNNVAEVCIPEEERKTYLNATSIKTIVQKLKEHPVYEFTTYHNEPTGERRLKKYKFTYFSEDIGIILSTIEDITEVSEQDILTGGYNRQGFIRRAEQIINDSSEEDEFRILYFDIKGFKAINEIMGIQGGDEVIRLVHNEIQNSRIKPLTSARTTTDHFICLIKRDDLNFDALAKLCQNITYTKNGKMMTVYLRCGIYNIDDKSISISSMYDRAKLAASNIKNEYVSPFAFYEKSLSKVYIDKNEVLGDLKRALDNNEFEAFYQPIFDAKTRKIASAEALVRWRHPERGMVSPGIFVPVLEENGHISQVDLFIEKSVKRFNEERIENGKNVVPVSVNLSRMDFFDTEMISDIFKDVENSEHLRDLYRFEVTESSYVSIANHNIKTLSSMRNLGAKILVDDFGSGYSSFNTITEYDFDIIKIDMELIRKIGENKKVEGVISSIIDMAHALDAKVVAEGAETEEQVNFLTNSNCDYIQGYYFSKPLPREEFEKLLDEQTI